jgi:hypothetical protein
MFVCKFVCIRMCVCVCRLYACMYDSDVWSVCMICVYDLVSIHVQNMYVCMYAVCTYMSMRMYLFYVCWYVYLHIHWHACMQEVHAYRQQVYNTVKNSKYAVYTQPVRSWMLIYINPLLCTGSIKSFFLCLEGHTVLKMHATPRVVSAWTQPTWICTVCVRASWFPAHACTHLHISVRIHVYFPNACIHSPGF